VHTELSQKVQRGITGVKLNTMDNKILYTAKFTHHDLKFQKVWWKSDKRCGSWSGQTDRQADSYILPQTMFAGGIIIGYI
jgi:hypothetical protein